MKTRIMLNRWDEYCRSVKIEVETDAGTMVFGDIMQSQSMVDLGETEPATVNWPGIGSVSPSVAKAASRALAIAAQVAEDMEMVEEWKRITPPAEGLRWKGDGMPEVFIAGGKAWVKTDGWEAVEDGDENAERAQDTGS